MRRPSFALILLALTAAPVAGQAPIPQSQRPHTTQAAPAPLPAPAPAPERANAPAAAWLLGALALGGMAVWGARRRR